MASAASAGYQRQKFFRSEAGNLSDSDHKATYELPPGVYDGRDTYISFEAACVSPAYSSTSNPPVDDVWKASPSGAVYQTQLVLQRDDLPAGSTQHEILNQIAKATISADPAQMIRFADLRFEKVGNVHHVQDVSMWKRVFDEITKTPNRKKAEASQRGISVGSDVNEIFYSPFQNLYTTQHSSPRTAELRANISEILPILNQTLDTRGAGQTFIETYMDIKSVRGVSAAYPLLPEDTFYDQATKPWGGYIDKLDPVFEWDGVVANRRRPRFMLPLPADENTRQEVLSSFAYGNKMAIMGISDDDGNHAMSYRMGTISCVPDIITQNGDEFLFVELLDMQAKLPDGRTQNKGFIDTQNFAFSVFTPLEGDDSIFKRMAIIPEQNLKLFLYFNNTADRVNIWHKVVIPGSYTTTAECGYYVGQHVVVKMDISVYNQDGTITIPDTDALGREFPYYSSKYDATGESYPAKQEINQTNAVIVGMELLSDGTVELELDKNIEVSVNVDYWQTAGNTLAPAGLAGTLTVDQQATSGDTIIGVNQSDILNKTLNQPISGPGIPNGTVILDISYSNATITLSQAITDDIATDGVLTVTAVDGAFITPSCVSIWPVNGPEPSFEIGRTALEVRRLPASVKPPTTIATYDFNVARQTLTNAPTVNYTFKSDPSSDFMLLMFPNPNPHHPTLSAFDHLSKYRIYVNNAPQTPFDVSLDPKDKTTHLRYVDQFMRSRGISIGDLSMQYQLAYQTQYQKMKTAVNDLFQDSLLVPEKVLCIPVLVTPGVEQTVQFQLYINQTTFPRATNPTFEVSILERKQKMVDLDPSKML